MLETFEAVLRFGGLWFLVALGVAAPFAVASWWRDEDPDYHLPAPEEPLDWRARRYHRGNVIFLGRRP
jgi:hypothetical protein